MAHYVVGFLRRASHPPQLREEELERLQEGHLAHLRRLREQGELILTGPFEEDTDLRGLLVFRTNSLDHAHELMRNDPTLLGGRLVLELHPWYSLAALAGLQAPGTSQDPGPLTFETD